MAPHKYCIETKALNNSKVINNRINKNLPSKTQQKIKEVLEYIYLDTSNFCSKDKLRQVEQYLTISEIYLANWLTNKTNDTKGKLAYGMFAILEAKDSKYSCRECGEDDVRTLEIDHIDNNRQNQESGNFKCLCGSCHNKKTRTIALMNRVENMEENKRKIIQAAISNKK